MTQPVWDDSIPRLAMYKRAGHLGCLAVVRAVATGQISASTAASLVINPAAKREFTPFLERIGCRFLRVMCREFGRSAVSKMGHELLLSLFQIGWQRTATALAGAIKKTVDPTTRSRRRKK